MVEEVAEAAAEAPASSSAAAAGQVEAEISEPEEGIHGAEIPGTGEAASSAAAEPEQRQLNRGLLSEFC